MLYFLLVHRGKGNIVLFADSVEAFRVNSSTVQLALPKSPVFYGLTDLFKSR